MTGSLFPDPPKQRKRRARRTVDDVCCTTMVEYLGRQADARRKVSRVMHFVHRLGHSRTPFSARKVVDLTGCSNASAAAAIRTAVAEQWVVPIETYSADDPSLYCGVL